MECLKIRFLLLLVALLTYLVVATTVLGNGMIEKNGGVDHEEVVRRSRWQLGRKIGAVAVHREGSKSIRALESVDSSLDQKPSEPKTTTFHASDHVAEEVFDMLHRDYQAKARRRPPINNAVPAASNHQSNAP